MGNNQKQIAVPPLPAAHKWKRKVLRARLAVSEQQLADGCGAEMIHTDSTVSVTLP